MNDIVKSILAAVLSMLFFLGLTEVAVRIWTGFNTFYDIEMSRYANELKLPDDDPKIGHVHRPGGRAHLMDVDVEINSVGLRDREYPVERGAARRIAFLGDSLTLAWGVSKDEAFETRLEAALSTERPTEVLNFGTGNYNTEQQVHHFLERGIRYEPDHVVVFYFINDAEPTPVQSRWGFLGHSRAITFFWSRIHATIGNTIEGQSFQDFYAGLYDDDRAGWRATRDAFAELARVCRERGIGLQVVLLPELHDLVDYPFLDEHAKVRGHLEGLGVESLDLFPFFEGESDPHRLWVSLDDAHPNSTAHAMIAEYSLDFIAQAFERQAAAIEREGMQ